MVSIEQKTSLQPEPLTLTEQQEVDALPVEGEPHKVSSLVSLFSPIHNIYSSAGQYALDLCAKLSWRDSILKRAELAEHHLLSRLFFFDTSIVSEEVRKEKQLLVKEEPEATEFQNEASQTFAKQEYVYLSDKEPQKFINTFFMDNTGNRELKLEETKPTTTLVMTHGYGAGLGMYYRNYASLRHLKDWRIYSIDWLGMGRSGRMPLPVPQKDMELDIDQVESYFVDSLEEWRIKCGIEKMTLLGHSLGGYLSTCYTLKFPERVEKLILVSPAGFSPRPDVEAYLNHLTPTRRHMVNLFSKLWEWNVTPGRLIRNIGPFSQNIVRGYATRRFTTITEQDREDLIAYFHGISTIDGAGEFALNRLLYPGGWARRPLFEKLTKIKVPVVFFYGDVDFMDQKFQQKC